VRSICFRVVFSAAERADAELSFPRASVSDALDISGDVPVAVTGQAVAHDSVFALKIVIVIAFSLFGVAVLCVLYLLVWIRRHDPYLRCTQLLPCVHDANLR
jgi:hypothetical protein